MLGCLVAWPACSRKREEARAAAEPAEIGSARFQGTRQARWPDDEVARGVRSALLAQLGSKAAASIAVDVKHGVAVLSGASATLLARQAAAAAAAMVRGVRSVVDEIRVIPPPRPDEEIREDVRAKLRDLPFARSVVPSASRGIVTLTGSVGSMQERRAAGHAAAGVAGVVDVRDQLTVKPPRERADAAIERDVQDRLRWALPLEAPLIDVDVDGGVVRLGGRVATSTDFNRAEMLAAVIGARGVDVRDLTVDPDAVPAEPKAPAALPATNAEIAQAVRDAWFYDPRVISFRLSVSVNLGEATVEGTAPNLFVKRAALDDARHTAGITSVRDEVDVASPPATDAAIAARVAAALARDPIEDLSRVQVQVDGGRVVLEGHLTGELAHQRALEVVSSIPGVRALEDHLLIAR